MADKTAKLLRSIKATAPKLTPIATDMILPNLSGDHGAGRMRRTPVNATDIANKAYVDAQAGGAPEGTAVLSTGEGGGTKFLREDGDGTSSWQTAAGSGDVTAAVNLTDVTIVQGDGGAKGVKTSTATVGQIAANVTHVAGSGSDHADVASNTTHRGLTNDPHNVTAAQVGLGSVSNVSTDDTAYNATTWNANLDSATKNAIRDKVETMDTAISSNTSASHAESHNVASHSDTTATGAELNTLTGGGDTTLHDHDGISENTTHRSSDGSNHSKVTANETAIALNTTHRNDNTQAHSDYLLNSAADVGVGLTLTGDNASADTNYVPMVLYNTDATPPAASGFPIGTIYIQYTA